VKKTFILSKQVHIFSNTHFPHQSLVCLHLDKETFTIGWSKLNSSWMINYLTQKFPLVCFQYLVLCRTVTIHKSGD